MHKKFQEYKDCHAGKIAYVFGKGPSVDIWKECGMPILPNSITISVNNFAEIYQTDYVFSTDQGIWFAYSGKIATFMAMPNDKGKSFEKKADHDWFLHCHDIRRDCAALRLTKDQIAETRWLYTASSSVQPAIHFAWYTGCSELILVGVDGGTGHSKHIRQAGDSPYEMMKKDTTRVANYLFGKKWAHYTDKYKSHIAMSSAIKEAGNGSK